MGLVQLSRITSRDLDIIFGVYSKNFPLSPWTRNFFLSYFKNEIRKPAGFCLKNEHSYIGFVWGRLSQKNPSFFNLSALWVSEESRNKGFAKNLIEALLAEVKKNKSARTACVTFRDSNNLKNFYSKLGFLNHRISGTYSNGETRHQMDLVL